MIKKRTLKNKSKLRSNIRKNTKNKNKGKKKNKKNYKKSNKKGGAKCCNIPRLDITYHPTNKPNVSNLHTLLNGYDASNKGYHYSNFK